MDFKGPVDDDSTEKVVIVEQIGRALKTTIEILIGRNVLTRDELQVTGKVKKGKHNLANRLSKLAWIFDSLVAALEERQLLDSSDIEIVYSLSHTRKNSDRAAGFAPGEFTSGLTLLLDRLKNRDLLSQRDVEVILELD